MYFQMQVSAKTLRGARLLETRVWTLTCGLKARTVSCPTASIVPSTGEFIQGTWAKSGGKILVPGQAGKGVSEICAKLRKRARSIMRAPSSYVTLACFADVSDEETAPLGWLVHAPHLIHYIYVRAPYRGAGLAHLMVREAISSWPNEQANWIPCTHWTTRLPREGWRLIGDTAFYYAGFEPLELQYASFK